MGQIPALVFAISLVQSTEEQEQGPPPGEVESVLDAEDVESPTEIGDVETVPDVDGVAVDDGSSADPDLEGEPASAPSWTDLFSGTWTLLGRSRFTAREADHDLWSTLSLRVGKENDAKISFHGLARLRADLDGPERRDFAEAVDAFGSSRRVELEEAHLRWRPEVDEIEELRLGRQTLFETPRFASLDGLSLDTGERDGPLSRAGAYGGLAHRLYQSSERGDWLGGLFAESRIESWRVRGDWMHLEDDDLVFDDDEDLFRFQSWWRPRSEFDLHGSAGWRDGVFLEYSVEGDVHAPDGSFAGRLRWYEQVQTLRRAVDELDPFFVQTFEERPFRQVDLRLAHALGSFLFLDVHGRAREMRRERDEGVFNREFRNVGATLSTEEIGEYALSPALFADWWTDSRTRMFALGGELDAELPQDVEAALGTDFALFRTDPLRGQERERSRRWWLRLRRNGPEGIRLECRYDLERDTRQTTHTLTASSTWRF